MEFIPNWAAICQFPIDRIEDTSNKISETSLIEDEVCVFSIASEKVKSAC